MSRGVAGDMLAPLQAGNLPRGWLVALSLAAAACGSERKAEAPGGAAVAGEAGKGDTVAPAADPNANASASASSATAKEVKPVPVDADAVAKPPPAPPSPIPTSARQMILGVVDDWAAVPVELSRWERVGDSAAWRQVGEPWTGVVGSGTAWGRGLHGEGPPAGQNGPQKKEGDGKSPAGVFALGGAYGYAAKPPEHTRWSYTPVDGSWHCVDDSASKLYGTIVDADDVAKDWKSSEKMKRRDALYTWVVDVAHNPAHAPGGGSCIFLHVWRAAGTPTVGCTAMPDPQLQTVLAWLDPAAKPVYALLPRQALSALSAGWGLPVR